VNEIGANPDDWGSHFVLVNDISLAEYTGTEFNIIGHNYMTPFTGVFDGNGHTISSFTYAATDTEYIGLFGCVNDANALIKDLTLVTPDVNAAGNSERVGSLVGRLRDGTITGCGIEGGGFSGGHYNTGGLVGGNFGTISNCYATGSVTGYSSTGGLVGLNYGTISNCYSEGSVSGDDYSGGLVGFNVGTISNCYAKAGVTGGWCTGGLVGWNSSSTIQNCYAAGSVSGNYDTGGLVGFSFAEDREETTLWDCYSTGTVSGNGCVGGLIGTSYCSGVIRCYSSASVSGHGDIGGLVGHCDSYGEERHSLWVCYSTGTVSGNGSVGGLVGSNFGTGLRHCYSVNSVSGSNQIGGLVGYNSSTGTIENCSSAGNVWGTEQVGGLIGNSKAIIKNCYATAKVDGNDMVGGLVGFSEGLIEKCYSAGNVIGDTNVGGLLGYDSGEVNACFWDVNTTGRASSAGGEGAAGKTTSEMISISTFIDAGWDFLGETANGLDESWRIKNGLDYPRLRPRYSGGLGTADEPYLITSRADFLGLGANLFDWDRQFRMTDDIDLSVCMGVEVNNIGNEITPFTGVFDGNGHAIYNFTYYREYEKAVGLFGYVEGANAGIKNLKLIDPNVHNMYIPNSNGTGCLVGWLQDGWVTSCSVIGGNVSGYAFLGGIVGRNCGDISTCCAGTDVKGYRNCGGLAALNYGRILNCYSSSTLSHIPIQSYDIWIGGLVGYNYCEVSNCYSSGRISSDGFWIGGLIGDNDGTVDTSFWDVNTTGQSSSDGGEGKTTAEMKTESTFTDAGWDFVGEVVNGPNDIWDICEAMNYPKLVWQIPVADLLCPDGVNFIDYSFFAGHWLDGNCAGSNDCEGTDLDQSGAVDIDDVKILCDNWLEGLIN